MFKTVCKDEELGYKVLEVTKSSHLMGDGFRTV